MGQGTDKGRVADRGGDSFALSQISDKMLGYSSETKRYFIQVFAIFCTRYLNVQPRNRHYHVGTAE